MKVSAAKRRAAWFAGIAAFAIMLVGGGSFALRSPKDPAELLEILTSRQTDRDVLPLDGSESVAGPEAIAESSRFLGGTETADFWVVLDGQQNICLVSVLKESSSAGTSCASPRVFAQHGIRNSVSVSGEDAERTEAYFVPDGFQAAALPSGLLRVSRNLVAGDSRYRQGQVVFFSDSSGWIDGTTIKFPLMH